MTKIRTGIEKNRHKVRIREGKTKRYSPVDSKYFIVAIDSGALSGCMIMYPMVPAEQCFFLRKVGFELSYRRRRSEVMLFILQLLKTSIN